MRPTLPLLSLTVAVAMAGCAPYQYSQFRGSVTRGGDAAAAPVETHDLGGQFGRAVDDAPDAVQGFQLGGAGGSVVLVYDKAGLTRNRNRLSDDVVSAVYFTERSPWADADDVWADFLRSDTAGRDATPGVRRLHGAFRVERWRSNVDFRIRLDMHAGAADPVRVEGVIATFDRWEFRPSEWLAWTGFLFGFGGPASRVDVEPHP